MASVTGGPFSVAKEADLLTVKQYQCNYTSADGTSELNGIVLASGAAINYDGDLQADGTGATQISGLGDKALSGVLGQDALFGNVEIEVTNLQSDAAAETLIRALQPKL